MITPEKMGQVQDQYGEWHYPGHIRATVGGVSIGYYPTQEMVDQKIEIYLSNLAEETKERTQELEKLLSVYLSASADMTQANIEKGKAQLALGEARQKIKETTQATQKAKVIFVKALEKMKSDFPTLDVQKFTEKLESDS